MSNTFNNSLYACPTRLERAYANYLLQTCFSGALPISGREAVVFLTKSNLSRLLLREIWNIVDPHQHGTLVQPEQWWTLLKLVALAQQQQQQQNVQQLLQVLNTLTPLPVFANVVIPSADILLQQYSSAEDGLSSVNVSNSGAPTQNTEWNNQSQQPQKHEWQAPVDFNAPKQTTSLSAALDELGGMEDMPLPSLGLTSMAVPEDQENHSEEEEDDFGDFENAPAITAASQEDVIPETQVSEKVEDVLYQAPAEFNTSVPQTTSLEVALEQLGPIQNAPLPSLSTVEVEQQVDNDENSDDEFGDFEAPEAPSTTNTKGATTDPFGGFSKNATPATVPLSSALDEVGSSHDVPLPPLENNAPVVDENDNDKFGDFEVPEEPETTTTSIEDESTDAFGGFNSNATRATVPLSSALDELGSSHDVPLPPLDNAPVVDESDNDEFGDFEAPAVPATTAASIANQSTSDPFGDFNPNTTPATVPLSSALDELGSSHDVPLPLLDTAPIVDETDVDEFGDFEAPAVPATTAASNEKATTSDPFGDFNPNTTLATVPLSSALDELGSSQDVPLPPLENNAPVVDENDNDKFGDFEAPEVPATTASSIKEATTSDSFGGFSKNSTAAMVPLSSALDELGSSRDVPLPPLDDEPVIQPQPAGSDENDDDFGEFEGPEVTMPLPDASKEDAFPGFHKQNNTPAIVPLSMALDELGPTMDAPLPPLGAAVVGESNQEVNMQDEVENDEFGNFVARPAESIELFTQDEPHDEPLEQAETDVSTDFKMNVAAPVVTLSSALDELGSSRDATLPSLDTFAVVSEPKSFDEDEEDFGDFEDAPNNNHEEKVESAATKQEDLVPDVPSPTLPSNGGTADEVVDFEAPMEATSLSSALDSLGAIQDAPLPPLGIPIQPQYDEDDDDDVFGDFEAPRVEVQEADDDPLSSLHDALDSVGEQPQQRETAEVQEATLDPLSSALDSLGPTQDAPLPSLGFTESQSREESDNDDDFGKFNGVPNGTGSSDDPLASTFAGFDPAEDKLLPYSESHAQNAVPKVPDIEVDEFGSFEASPENKEESGIQEAESEHFNGLVSSDDISVEPSQHEPLPADSQPLDPSSDLGNDVTEASAFDAIAPVENSPLPSFGMHKVAHEIAPAEEHDDSQESDFGRFEGPLYTETAESDDKVQATNQDAEEPTISEPSNLAGFTNLSDPFVSVFDTITPVEDAPLPALESEEIPTEDTAGHVASTADEIHQSDDDEDGFGSFEDATGTEDGVKPQNPEKAEEVTKDDIFGQDQDTAIRVPKEDYIVEDLFSNSVVPIDEPLPTFHSASGSDFSGFETASENITSEEKKGEIEKVDGDDVGGFSGASHVVGGTEDTEEAVPSDPTNSGHDDDDDDDDDFGDFTAIEAPVEAASGFDTEWGDFEEPSGVETSEVKLPNEVPATTRAIQESDFAANFATDVTPESDVDDEFGSFQEIEYPGTEKEETLEEIAIRVLEMQKTLTIQDSKGEQIDFVKMFRENLQVGKPASGWRLGFNKNAQKTIDPAESLKRAQRCCQVMNLLTTSNKSSLSHWEKTFNVVRDELAMGSFILEEAKSIAGEKAVYSALGMWVAGLGEYVRVTRSIAATLCDMLCLDIDADVLQMKNIMALLDSAFEVEDLWTTVQGASKELNLALPRLETVSDIRTRCLQRFSAGNLCQLTLQPLSDEDKGTTKNPVEWSGRRFFACAANFWSNRVSTDVPV